jgi:hypothetical protein
MSVPRSFDLRCDFQGCNPNVKLGLTQIQRLQSICTQEQAVYNLRSVTGHLEILSLQGCYTVLSGK